MFFALPLNKKITNVIH